MKILNAGTDFIGYWKDRFGTNLIKFKDTGLYFETLENALVGFVSCHTVEETVLKGAQGVAIPFVTYDQGTRFGTKYGVPYSILVASKELNQVALIDSNYKFKPKIIVTNDYYKAVLPNEGFKELP